MELPKGVKLNLIGHRRSAYEFSSLAIDERVSSIESVEVIYEGVCRYLEKNGPPAAKRQLSVMLERGIMDIAIGHDFEREIALSVECIKMARQGVQPANRITQSALTVPSSKRSDYELRDRGRRRERIGTPN
jgi:hypothetical protein